MIGMVVAGRVGVMEEEVEDAGMEVNVTDEAVEGVVIVVTVLIVVIVIATVGGVEQEVEEAEVMVLCLIPMLSRHCKSEVHLECYDSVMEVMDREWSNKSPLSYLSLCIERTIMLD
jgi:hypothetical protein